MTIRLLSPEDKRVEDLLSAHQHRFLEDGGTREDVDNSIDWQNLIRTEGDFSQAEPCHFSWTIEGDLEENVRVSLRLSENAAFCGYRTFDGKDGSVSVYNLCLGRTYYWCVAVTGEQGELAVSEVRSFTTRSFPPRFLFAEGITNVRDLGGWPSALGVIRQGLFYRGSEFDSHHDLTEEGRRVLTEELHIRTDLDLRGEVIGKVFSTRLGKGALFTHIPCSPYEEFIADKETFRKLFSVITDRENYPIYTHCWGGADRTGTFVLVLSALLGVSESDLFLDYELTTLSVWGNRSRKSELFGKLLAALDEYDGETINEKVEAFTLSCGISSAEIEAFRSIMLER